MDKQPSTEKEYDEFISSIGELLNQGRIKIYSVVNQILVKTYWEIGKIIIEFEQKGKEKVEYGSGLFDRIAKDLKFRYGKGFSRSNIIYMRLLYMRLLYMRLLYMRLLYMRYPKSQTLSDQLAWSHYVELLMIDDDLERSFYEKQCIQENWSIRELKRQKNSALFHRLALSKDKAEVLELAKGNLIRVPKDIIKDPYILKFLGVSENHSLSEKDLEQKIIDNLQKFLLELGKGFTFVARQKRITLGNKHYYIDLVFYHRILRCFVLIDLKINTVTPEDIGQMNLYLNYFKKEETTGQDNEPIGIILAKEKEKIVIEYALGGMSNKLFVSKYKLYLPTKEELEKEIERLL